MNLDSEPKQPYRGRFAPSPSGPLHFGSLVCALASFLDAKSKNGSWLVRIEDLDPPREQAGATESILESLIAHGLNWDEQVTYQSQRSPFYEQHLNTLAEKNLSYRCACTRKRLSALNGVYDGYCRNTPPAPNKPAAIRLNLNTCYLAGCEETSFVDGIQGKQPGTVVSSGDFIIHRKDGLFAYQLAVVVDDIAQNISHVVRGMDLLETTSQQRYLFNLLGSKAPAYSHIPVLADNNGNKLSKQNHAKAINNEQAFSNLHSALEILGMNVPDAENIPSISALLNWGITRWNPLNIARHSSILAPSHTM